jgi:hypothetical protein
VLLGASQQVGGTVAPFGRGEKALGVIGGSVAQRVVDVQVEQVAGLLLGVLAEVGALGRGRDELDVLGRVGVDVDGCACRVGGLG